MGGDKEKLLRIAEAVSDGSPVRWDLEEKRGEDIEGPLGQLRVLERIAALHSPGSAGARSGPECRPEAKPSETPTQPPPPEAWPIARWGHLEVLEAIGHGGFGEIYRAHDPQLERDVALKLVRRDRTEDRRTTRRFLNEARRLARVRHPNVLVVHGADRHDGRVGLWTDLLEGKTLEQCLDEQGPFSAGEATNIGITLCGALAAVHAADLVHRDVKTANVMREAGGRIVLMDFNSVSEPGRLDGDADSGTPVFMAPEQFRGVQATPATDIYSLGVVLYRLVSGRYPVDGRTLEEIRAKHERGESMPLRSVRPDLPPAFVQVVERAMARDPRDRYATVAEMERALAAPGPDGGRGKPEEERPWWRRPLPVASMAAVLVAVVAGVIWLLPPAPLEVEASLFRAKAGGVEERLLPGGQVSPGDLLFLEIQGSRDMHVYVLNEDRMGDAFVLFPLPDVDGQNPLQAGATHRLPGAVEGTPNYWEVSSIGGREAILIIAARDPLQDLEREMERIPRVGANGPIQLDRRARQVLRGIGKLAAVPDTIGDTGSPPPLSAIFSDLSGRVAGDGAVWFWQIRLENSER